VLIRHAREEERKMIELYDATTGAKLGTISEAGLQFLKDQLEEESVDDQDYYINQVELATFAERGAPTDLLDVLTTALGDLEEMDVRWEAA
jgi:hypothetical protein